MRGASRSTLGRYGLYDDAPPSWKADACLCARLRDKASHVSIIEQRWIVEREVPHHGAGPFEELVRITKNSASQKEEIDPPGVEDDRQCRVGRTFGRREADYETGVAVAD